MFLSLWQKLWNGKGGPARGEGRVGDRYHSCRPQLDALEDRLLPAPAAGGLFPFAAGARALAVVSPAPAAARAGGIPTPAVAFNAAAGTALVRLGAATAAGVGVGGLEPVDSNPLGGTAPTRVTVGENSPKSQIDLGPVFAAMSGLRHDGGLTLSVLGNTNPGLVKADLSETALTLSYTLGKAGAATVTICATDADGVSRHATILVTVLPFPLVFHRPEPF
jgi:hypothetical protein